MPTLQEYKIKLYGIGNPHFTKVYMAYPFAGIQIHHKDREIGGYVQDVTPAHLHKYWKLGQEEEKFKVLQGGNQVNSKIFDMILNAKTECRILGSEKDFMKFYHANFLDALEEHQIDYKILTPTSKKSKYIFDDLDKSKVKKLCSTVKENLCFLIKDDDEVLFFIKNEGNNKEMRAIWTNSETIIYSKALLFDNIWTKTDSSGADFE